MLSRKLSPRPSLTRGRLDRIVRRGLRRNSVENDVPVEGAIDLAVVVDGPASIVEIVPTVATVAKVDGPAAGVRLKVQRRSSSKN
jgi:hypothetical protein